MGNKLLRNRYKSMPLPLKATIWFAVCQILQKGISILITPFMTRLMPAEEYGRASTYMAWEGIFAIFITLSSGHAVLNLCAKTDNRERALSNVLGLNLTIALIWFLALVIFRQQVCWTLGISWILVLCLFMQSLAQSNIFCWNTVMNYAYSYRILIAEALFHCAFSSFGALFAIISISRTAEAKIIPPVISAMIISTGIVLRSAVKGRSFYDPRIWKYALGFCVPQIPHYLSEIVLMSSDRIMIDRMCGASEVAIYSVAYSVGSLISMVTSAVNSAFAPYQYQKITSKEYKTLAKNTDYIIAFVAFCLCGLMLFGREIVLVFGGEKYIESISLVIPISLGVFFNYVFQLFARVQEYYEQKHTIVIASISCAALNVMLNYIFISIFGYQAAAYTTFVCYFIFCFLHYHFYRKACKIFVGQEIYDTKGLLMISAGLIIAAVIIALINKLFVLKYVIVAIVFAIIMWRRRNIIDFIKMIRRKE